MTLNDGKFGGIVFRVDSTNTLFYYFRIGIDGTYALDVYTGNGSPNTLSSTSSSSIMTGVQASNQLTVVARDNSLYLYVNGQYITTVTDSTYSAGEIGVFAGSFTDPTAHATFNDAKVWTL